MMKKRLFRWMEAFSVAGLLAFLAAGLVGCSASSTGPGGSAAGGGGGKDDLVVGFIYIGPKKDYGYTQAHQTGAEAVKKMPGVKVLEVEKVAEDEGVQQKIKKMIVDEKAKVIFASSYGYFDPHVIAMAKKYPKVQFLHCGAPKEKLEGLDNVCSYFGYIDECQYISGIVAGHMTKTNKLGFVAAKPIPQVRRNINAFCLGARSVNPKAEVYVLFTGDWLDPSKEADSTKILIDKGCDVFTCHVDSPQVIVETVEKSGKMMTGYHASQAELAPKGYLVGAEWNWEKLYPELIEKIKKGEKLDHYIRGGLKEGIVKMGPYGPAVTPEAKKDADAAKEKLMKGDFVIFKGPLKGKDDKGNPWEMPAGKEYKQNDPALEGMNYFVDGVIAQ
jgi:basic membrane protein A and related proteins